MKLYTAKLPWNIGKISCIEDIINTSNGIPQNTIALKCVGVTFNDVISFFSKKKELLLNLENKYGIMINPARSIIDGPIKVSNNSWKKYIEAELPNKNNALKKLSRFFLDSRKLVSFGENCALDRVGVCVASSFGLMLVMINLCSLFNYFWLSIYVFIISDYMVYSKRKSLESLINKAFGASNVMTRI
jgi:hypothetical protein